MRLWNTDHGSVYGIRFRNIVDARLSHEDPGSSPGRRAGSVVPSDRVSFGAWLKAASERLHRNKLAVALADKLARIAWSVLHHDRAFDTHLEVAAI